MKLLRIVMLLALLFALLIFFGIIPGISERWAYVISIIALAIMMFNKEFKKPKE